MKGATAIGDFLMTFRAERVSMAGDVSISLLGMEATVTGESNEGLGKKMFNIQVEGEDPLKAAVPTFANFVAVSHAGSEVQFEFIFLDLNHLAKTVEIAGKDKAEKPIQLNGRTVAKVIVPVSNFIQLKDHLNTMFTKLEEATHVVVEPEEATQEGRRSASR